MSTTLSNCLSLNIDGDVKIMGKQGIVTILRSDCERTKAASLRRTLSADMSSKKWLAQNGFSPLRKNASSDQLSASLEDSSSSSEGEEDYEERKEQLEEREHFHIWSSIQEQKQKKELEKPGQFDIWSSFISQKANEDTSTLPAPYIHPLVKRSSSCLSEKSLQVCTESLGSETGSDGFSSYPPSETGEAEDEKEEEEDEEPLQEDLKGLSQAFDMEESRIPKYHYASTKKSQPRSFPPPLPSLSRRDGASLRMQSRRDNGRLVLEAVSVPSQNRFQAQRKDGRLVLTFLNGPSNGNAIDEEMVGDFQRPEQQQELHEEEKTHKKAFDEEFGDFEEVYGEEVGEENEETEESEEAEEVDEEVDNENETKEIEIVMEQAPKMSSRVINFHRLALMAKPIRMADRNPAWPGKFNVDDAEVEEVGETPSMAKSLPLRPRVGRLIASPPAVPSTAAAAASLNAYEYYWRAKPSTANPITQPPTTSSLKNNGNKLIISKTPMANDHRQQQQLFVLRGNKGNYFVPLVKSCKEPRRSLLIWEPDCIATS